MILDEEEYIEFLKKVDEGLKHPVGLVPTPKIEEARRLIKEYCAMEKFLEKVKNADPETLECIYDIVVTIFINQEINKIKFDCDLDEAEIKIINVISEFMTEIDDEIKPKIDISTDYENNTVTINITFRDDATTCIGPLKIKKG